MNLVQVRQFAPAKSGSHRALDVDPSIRAQAAHLTGERLAGDHPQVVAVGNAILGQTFRLAQRDFAGHVPDRRGDFNGDELVEVGISVVAADEQHGPPSGWLPQFGPPDVELPHSFHSSAESQVSASSAESGCSRYASRMRSVSRWKRASFTAFLMKSARWRLAAGAIRSIAFSVDSSKWTKTWGMQLYYRSTLYGYPGSTARGWGRNELTWLSEGVVEAEIGLRERFGFHRTRAISGRSAREIADAAKAWGQNDDITVVTVRRTK